MRFVVSLLSKLNRPLPGWLTLSLFLGAATLAAPPVFNGSINLLTGATITDTNATASACVGTNSSKVYTYGSNCITSVTNGANITPMTGPTPTVAVTANPSFGNVTAARFNGSYSTTIPQFIAQGPDNGSAAEAEMTIQSNKTTKPDSADAVGYFTWTSAAFTGPNGVTAAKDWGGISGATAGDFGGYHVFETKYDGGGLHETIVLDPQGHIYLVSTDDAFYLGPITTPASCSAGVTCGTYTYTFQKQFFQPNGTTAETPICTGLAVQDVNTSSDMWVADIASVSSTSITINYGSPAAITGAKTIYITGNCWDASY